jgi:DNA-binding MltR family transcriptional regulator
LWQGFFGWSPSKNLRRYVGAMVPRIVEGAARWQKCPRKSQENASGNLIPPEDLSKDGRKLLEVLNDESDLAAVLIAASFHAEQLATLLVSRFIQNSSTATQFLYPSKGVLGEFRARSQLSHCLGLISKLSFNDLCAIGEIRNLFAHSHLQMTFEDQSIQEKCSALETWQQLEPLKKYLTADIEERSSNARGQFKITVVMLLADLEIAIQSKQPEVKSPPARHVIHKRVESPE